ncbi:helix-turn-helix domain-containing protein [Roseofilum sp. BLCC_M154]|uniref:Helix-turn-helix domain-containing protein n=1 Tax=Roseofilum acuticapitatum BLCC-M154 TaxID=3022444 RepID=A0ABT7ASE2_9CYAN|nr:hypothetical protein [Roseofilum acuticapitatum]MDJ1169832.1 helix-turn-helix domain-containing protein [Roseofilum acuticapitatum BLCC-M154]
MPPADEQFTEAANSWDLKTLYSDLAAVKGKPLTPVEKLHLRGLLCGYSPAEMAEKLQKNSKGVETDLCATIYKYVKNFVGKGTEKIDNWRTISQWMEEAGYKEGAGSQTNLQQDYPDSSQVNVTNIKFENNQIKIGVYLQLTVPLPPEVSLVENEE